MNLMDFSQKTTVSNTFPVTILWPAGAKLAIVGDWTLRPDGQIEAVYHDADDLRLSLLAMQIMREPKPTRQQAALLPLGGDYYSL